LEGFINYDVEVGSSAMIDVRSFIKIGSGVQKLTRGDSQTHRQHGGLTRLFSVLAYFPFFEKEQK
jgi:hypothetical protein